MLCSKDALTVNVVVWIACVFAGAAWLGQARADAATMTADVSDPRYGATPDDAKDDTAAIQKAIDDLNQGGSLIIPPGKFEVSLGKGLTISKKHIHVIIRGTIEATTGGRTAPACKSLFSVKADGCQFIGQGGMLVGDGTIFTGQRDRDGLYPALIYVRGVNECSVSGLRLRNPPGAHVVFFATADSSLTNCVIEGGVERNTKRVNAYYAIFFRGASGLLIHGNHFKPFKGRQQYQWVTSSSTNTNTHISIVGNMFEGSFDHPIYCSGIRRSVVSNNTTRDTVGTAIKLIGTDLVVTGNNIYNAPTGGIECRIGSRCIVANNLVDGFGHNAIEISDYNNNRRSHTDNIVRGNILIGHMGKGKPPVMSGICITAAGTVSRCKVEGNIIHNSGTGNPELDATSPASAAITISAGKPSDAITITGNTVHNANANGINLNNVNSSLIVHNIIHCSGESIVQKNGRDNLIEKNIVSRGR